MVAAKLACRLINQQKEALISHTIVSAIQINFLIRSVMV